MQRPIRRICSLAAAALLWPAAALAELPDWNGVADVGQVQVLTRDADGAERDTTVWLAVVDGQGYIRTGSTTWGDNLVRNPDLVLRIDGNEYPLRAEFVEDETLREAVGATFREKYGWTDALVGAFRGSHPRIMRLLPRQAESVE
jgi:hypothetical protein